MYSTCNFHVPLFTKHDRIKCIYWCGFNAVSMRWNRINSWIDLAERMNKTNLCIAFHNIVITVSPFTLSLSCIISFGAWFNSCLFIVHQNSIPIGCYHIDEIDWNMWHNVDTIPVDTKASKFTNSIYLLYSWRCTRVWVQKESKPKPRPRIQFCFHILAFSLNSCTLLQFTMFVYVMCACACARANLKITRRDVNNR